MKLKGDGGQNNIFRQSVYVRFKIGLKFVCRSLWLCSKGGGKRTSRPLASSWFGIRSRPHPKSQVYIIFTAPLSQSAAPLFFLLSFRVIKMKHAWIKHSPFFRTFVQLSFRSTFLFLFALIQHSFFFLPLSQFLADKILDCRFVLENRIFVLIRTSTHRYRYRNFKFLLKTLSSPPSK